MVENETLRREIISLAKLPRPQIKSKILLGISLCWPWPVCGSAAHNLARYCADTHIFSYWKLVSGRWAFAKAWYSNYKFHKYIWKRQRHLDNSCTLAQKCMTIKGSAICVNCIIETFGVSGLFPKVVQMWLVTYLRIYTLQTIKCIEPVYLKAIARLHEFEWSWPVSQKLLWATTEKTGVRMHLAKLVVAVLIEEQESFRREWPTH